MLQQSSVGGAGGKSKEEVVLELSIEFATKLPAAFDKYPVMYLESMNSVLHQEMIRFNRLTDVIRSSLVTVQKTLRGLVVMSADIDKLITNIFQSKMPVMWAPYSYPTMKPVSSYFQDLLDRLKMLQNWFDVGPPPRFWISGFYFTHAFLTGVLQNFARKYRIPIDTIIFQFQTMPKGGNYETKLDDVLGATLRGCLWKEHGGIMRECYWQSHYPRNYTQKRPCFGYSQLNPTKRNSSPVT
ncbi:hypothetical protein BDL97_12G068400 [Sphagnum fallax]|nr:hypothetical protein BDL97_12G068400 [Sphagnum fallax]